MGLGIRVYKDDESPLYVQAADAVRSRILSGEFRTGDRLPSVRRLSDELGVNPATIVAAYRILTKEGFLEARAGSGAYVAASAPISIPLTNPAEGLESGSAFISTLSERPNAGIGGDIVDLAANAPPSDLFPLEDIKRFIAEAIDADGGRAFEYEDSSGYGPLRRAIAERMAREASRRGPPDPDDVHIVSGAQQGIDLAARVLLRRGDVAAVECPGYRGARDAFIAAGARVEALPMDEGGLDLGVLERLASKRPLRLVHVNPAYQNPTCTVYRDDRREAIAALAERYGFYVLEDDLFSDLAWDGVMAPSIRSFDSSGRVLLVKSFSKSLMPGLRIGAIEAPAAIRDRFESVKRSVDISSSGLMQRVLERFLSSGRFDSHLWAVRRRYQSAFDTFEAGLSGIRGSGLRWSNPGGGINAWIKVPARVSAKAFADRCFASGCAVVPETSF
ncbi:MAG: PLP-dependent aminotransferase family protein, partial [Spirochaetales bacterium]|nr:PLP-dependent aminotransferase family protein [Spirochaetales bacterium]